MKSGSIKSKLYLLTAFIISMLVIIPAVYFLQQSIIDNLNEQTQSLAEIEKSFSEIVLLEHSSSNNFDKFDEIKKHYRVLQQKLTKVDFRTFNSLLEERRDVFEEFYQVEQDLDLLFNETHFALIELINSTKYIHEHHIAHFKNLLRRGIFEQDYDNSEDFHRESDRSASEVDIISAAVNMQTGLFDLVDVFNALQQKSDLAIIGETFDDAMKVFISSVNSFEDYSLDAQDGLLVEELLLGGRAFEKSFESLISLREKQGYVSRYLNENRKKFLNVLHESNVTLKASTERSLLYIHFIQAVIALLVIVVILIIIMKGKSIVSDINKTVNETEKIQEDLSYQIDVDDEIFDEFRIVFHALNSMATKINKHVKELQEVQGGLEETVKNRTAELLEANKQLSIEIDERIRFVQEKETLQRQLQQAQKMEAIGTLAGGIAHDFNNILMAVIGYAELTKIDIAQQKESSDNIDQVVIAANRARDLVKQILTFSRKSEHSIEPISPYLIVKESLKLLRASLPTTISIQEEIDTSSGTIMADPTKVQQVVVNLCTNALHAMENQQGVLTVKVARRELRIGDVTGMALPGTYIELEVTDTGHGMDRATKDRIFEPYFTTKDVGKGTGMGLAMLHGIIQEYRGMVTVDSNLGKGTTIRVYFPAVDVEVDAVREQDTYLPLGKENILVVDDEKMIIDIQKAGLEQLGYSVTTEMSSSAALDTFEKNPDKYDLVVTDQTMPDMTGAEMAKIMMTLRPDLPVILCTGFSSLISQEQAYEMGIKRYLMKPVSISELAPVVRKVLNEKDVTLFSEYH